MWGVLAVDGPHWGCHSQRWRVLPRSTLLRLPDAPWVHCPKRALSFVHFPDLSCSGSQVLCMEHPRWAVCFAPFPGPSHPGCSTRALSQLSPVFCALPRSELLRLSGTSHRHRPRWAVHSASFPGPSLTGIRVLSKCTVPGALMLLSGPSRSVSQVWCSVRAQFQVCHMILWGADLRLWPSWLMWTVQDPRRTRLAAGRLLTVRWEVWSLGPRLQWPFAFCLCLLHTCL